MKSKRLMLCLGLCLAMAAASPAAAADKPVNVSIISPLSLAKPTEGVTALRFNLIYGKNTTVEIVDLGLVNHTTSRSNGLQWGAFNYNEGPFNGVQLGTVNYDKAGANGLQWGAFNYAGTGSGLQLALVNYAEKLEGFQIGAINIAKTGGMFPIMVIANWKK